MVKQTIGTEVFKEWTIRRIEDNIKLLQAHIMILKKEKNKEIKLREKMNVLEYKYGVRQKGLVNVTEELKKRLLIKVAKTKKRTNDSTIHIK